MHAVPMTAAPDAASRIDDAGRPRRSLRPHHPAGDARGDRDAHHPHHARDARRAHGVSGQSDAASRDAVIPIAVAHPIAALITGVLRPATVLAAHSAAVVLRVEPLPGVLDKTTGAGDVADTVTRVVTLLTREGSGVPNGARTALSAADHPFAAFAVGDAAFVGGGGIRLPGRTFHAVRAIRTAVPHVAPTPDALRQIADAARMAPRGVADEPVDALRAALDSGDAGRLRAAVRALVGLGAGSTPGGDDVLAGTLAGLRARRRGVHAEQVAAAALPGIESRTPLMSADLLRLAAAGHVCTEAAAVLRASAGASVSGGARTALASALASLLALGHTSGADLATGLAIGLGAARTPEPRHARRSRTAPAAGADRANRAVEPLALH